MTDAWSITDGFHDAGGDWHETSADVRAALRAALDANGDQPPEPPPMWFVRAGRAEHLWQPADLVLEDGTELHDVADLPADLPTGYHRLVPRDGGPETALVVTPGRCPVPAERRWGWATQLYAVRSRASWGMGDLADLAELARWTAELGGGAVVVNPLHATAPSPPIEPSPYYASSRVFRSPLYLRVEDVAGAPEAGDVVRRLADEARTLGDGDRIDRDTVARLKLEALEHIHDRTRRWHATNPRLAAYRRREGDLLRTFATWCAIAEVHGPSWFSWPSGLRHPNGADVARFASERSERVELHEWLQWCTDEQLARAGAAGAGLIGDLAVGFAPDGADAWIWQDVLAAGARVGAPPDEFNAAGQDWGLPPFIPWKLRAAGYGPLVSTFRAAVRHVAGVRIDHVMGLFRLYVMPPGRDAASGAYVRYPAGDLLDLLALEADRAGAYVIGEDLGTVEDEVRAELAERRVLSYRLVWFEDDEPASYPEAALAAVTTHDLPTVAGVWSGDDLRVRLDMGLPASVEGDAHFREVLTTVTGLDETASSGEVVVAVHEALASAPSLVVVANLDDALGVTERPNHPGTTDQWPNWRLPLPVALEEIEQHPQVLAVARALGARRSGSAAVGSPPC